MRVTGLPQQVDQHRDYRQTTSIPIVTGYNPARMTFAIYALHLLALTSVTDPAILEQIRLAADQISTPENEPWNQFDAQTILAAAGSPPAPSHIVVTRIPGYSTFLVRAVAPGTPKAQRLVYSAGTSRPTVSMLGTMRAEGIVIPRKTCLEIPVKLVEDEKGLALAMLLRLRKSRATSEVEDDSADSTGTSEKK